MQIATRSARLDFAHIQSTGALTYSSSILVNAGENPQLYDGLLRMAREKATTHRKHWYHFSGQYDLLMNSAPVPLPSKFLPYAQIRR